MFEYKTEILETSVKFFSGLANKKDINELEKLININASEGWELVTYSYMMGENDIKGIFVITFRKQK